MSFRFLMAFAFVIVGFSTGYSDEVIWKGTVSADGTPTEPITLKLHEKYQIKSSHYINLGKWIQNSVKLANDACYEFSDKLPPTKLESLKNSQDIPICDGKYNPKHIYLSQPFAAKQNRIFFWISDVDYDDNTGNLDVEVIHITK